jgi:hypothetical protein
MPNTIAEYYTDELIDWGDSINFYIGEMAEFEQKLGDVIRRNSITGIAKKVELQQDKLNIISEKFHHLQTALLQQEAVLKTDSTLLDNSFISNETANRQNELRRKMQDAEKEYIDAKFECYNFLSGTLLKK